MEHRIKVPVHLTYNVMGVVDPEGLETRRIMNKVKREKKCFSSDRPLWLVSLDGHDKLCGYQNWTFPLGVYGCLDTFSRKVLCLDVMPSNSEPRIIGNLYLRFLTNKKQLPRFLRMDRGTETGKMTTIHVYLHNDLSLFGDPVESVIYGPSTNNTIEWWWRDLHERLAMYFKLQLKTLLDSREYDPHDMIHRQLLAYVYIPIIRRERRIFQDVWNAHQLADPIICSNSRKSTVSA